MSATSDSNIKKDTLVSNFDAASSLDRTASSKRKSPSCDVSESTDRENTSRIPIEANNIVHNAGETIISVNNENGESKNGDPVTKKKRSPCPWQLHPPPRPFKKARYAWQIKNYEHTVSRMKKAVAAQQQQQQRLQQSNNSSVMREDVGEAERYVNSSQYSNSMYNQFPLNYSSNFYNPLLRWSKFATGNSENAVNINRMLQSLFFSGNDTSEIHPLLMLSLVENNAAAAAALSENISCDDIGTNTTPSPTLHASQLSSGGGYHHASISSPGIQSPPTSDYDSSSDEASLVGEDILTEPQMMPNMASFHHSQQQQQTPHSLYSQHCHMHNCSPHQQYNNDTMGAANNLSSSNRMAPPPPVSVTSTTAGAAHHESSIMFQNSMLNCPFTLQNRNILNLQLQNLCERMQASSNVFNSIYSQCVPSSGTQITEYIEDEHNIDSSPRSNSVTVQDGHCPTRIRVASPDSRGEIVSNTASATLSADSAIYANSTQDEQMTEETALTAGGLESVRSDELISHECSKTKVNNGDVDLSNANTINVEVARASENYDHLVSSESSRESSTEGSSVKKDEQNCQRKEKNLNCNVEPNTGAVKSSNDRFQYEVDISLTGNFKDDREKNQCIEEASISNSLVSESKYASFALSSTNSDDNTVREHLANNSGKEKVKNVLCDITEKCSPCAELVMSSNDSGSHEPTMYYSPKAAFSLLATDNVTKPSEEKQETIGLATDSHKDIDKFTCKCCISGCDECSKIITDDSQDAHSKSNNSTRKRLGAALRNNSLTVLTYNCLISKETASTVDKVEVRAKGDVVLSSSAEPVDDRETSAPHHGLLTAEHHHFTSSDHHSEEGLAALDSSSEISTTPTPPPASTTITQSNNNDSDTSATSNAKYFLDQAFHLTIKPPGLGYQKA